MIFDRESLKDPMFKEFVENIKKEELEKKKNLLIEDKLENQKDDFAENQLNRKKKNGKIFYF